jgi:hypothetical protein
MKFIERSVLVLLGTVMLFALHQYVGFLFERHGWKAMTIGDWGTWVGAVGAIGAMFGTIWIATIESRRRKRQDEVRGYIVAAALAPRLQLLSQEIGAFSARLEFVDFDSGQHGYPNAETSDFLAFKFIHATTDELIALESMPNNCATKLAYAQARLATIRTEIERYVRKVKHPTKPLNPKVAAVWEVWIRDLRGRVDVIARQCGDAANTHAAPPTQFELYGNVDD